MVDLATIATLTLVFTVAAALLVVSSRLGLPVVPFYLLAGIAVGWWVEETYLIELAQWGIAFLVFVFAVEVDPLQGTDVRLDATLISVLQIAVTGSIVFALVSVGFGLDLVQSLFVAIAGALSSTFVALGHIREQPVRPTVSHERLSETIHFVEDLVAIGFVLLLSAFAYAEGTGLPGVVAGVGLILAAFVVRAAVFERIASFADDDIEVLMLTGISMLIGFIALAEAAGVSIVVGAFAAGFAIPYDYPHDIDMLDAINYVQDFFVPIFFVTVGALVSVPDISTLGLGFVLFLAVTVVNPVIVAVLARWRGYDNRSALLTGLQLDQVSEFSLLIAIEAMLAEVITRGVFDAVVFAAVASMVLSAYSYLHGEKLHRFLVDRGHLGSNRDVIADRSDVPANIADHVIVVGYGPLSQQVVDVCDEIGRETVLIETDPALISQARGAADHHLRSDPMSDGTWAVASPETAALVVSTIPSQKLARRVIEHAGDTDVMVSATDAETARLLVKEGALFVAVPKLLAGERLAEYVERTLTDEEYTATLREHSRETIDQALQEF